MELYSDARPDMCDRFCKSKQMWKDNPDGYTEGPTGFIPNSDIANRATKICPGVRMVLDAAAVNQETTTINEDGSAVLPAGSIEIYCQYYERAYGDKA